MKARRAVALAAILLGGVALIISSLAVSNFVKAASVDTTGATITSILTASGDTLISSSSAHVSGDSYSGYIQSMQNSSQYTGDYYQVVFTIGEGIYNEDTEIFNFQPYDTSWGGWDSNTICFGEATYDSEKEAYVAYIDIASIKASLSSGGTFYGINISFLQKEPVVTLKELNIVTLPQTESSAGETGTGASTDNPVTLYTITEDDLIGISWQGSSQAYVYVEITSGGADSILNVTLELGPEEGGSIVGKTSSKYLVGSNVTSKSGNAIQDNLVGAAGTGYYVFPVLNLNESVKTDYSGEWLSEYAEYITIKVRAMSDDVACNLLGVVFSNGAVYKAVDWFSTSITTEAADYDVVSSETEMRDKLGKTLTYIESMDSTKYQTESWNTFLEAVAAAQAVYDNEYSTEDACEEAHSTLEAAKAALLFVDDESSSDPLPYRDLTNDELVYEMGVGINLGNTMDGHSGFTPSETAWQNTVTTKAYIEALHDAGYNTVRIPVTWGTMIDDENGYTIKDSWISRVQDIVDYCISLDMYVIINIHHDGAEQTGWLRVASDDIDAVYEKFEYVWRNIATYFKDYDEHLIFESMNEITSSENDKNGAEAIAYDTPIIMNLNQIFVNVVRSTGGNNTYRWLAVVSHYANTGTSSAYTFELPTDSYNEENRLIFAAHVYKSSTNTVWTYDEIYEVVNSLKSMANKFDVPLILGEWGTRTYAQSGTDTGYNDVARAYFSEIVTRACQVAGCVPVVWDQGYNSDDPYETSLYTYWNRATLSPLFANIIEAMMRGIYLEASSSNLSWNFTDIESDPEVIEFTDITLSVTDLTLTIGDSYTVTAETLPAESNDVVLWSSDDDSIVTVSRGILRARSIGTTTIRAYSQSGYYDGEPTVVATLTVTVMPMEVDEEAKITVNESEVLLVTGNYTYADVSLDGADEDYLTYRSSNEEIATVNASGKIVAISSGSCYIYVTSASGKTDYIKVNVSDSLNVEEIELSLHVLYNDSTNNYWGTEYSPTVTVTGDGQYTLTFDLETDLSTSGKTSGITTINNLTSIYIKDYTVSMGEATASTVVSAEIRYDQVIVYDASGTPHELTITDSSFYEAVNSSGVFDTGAPINAWGGTVVDGITINNYAASFTNISNPTKITVVFTLQNVEFKQAEEVNGDVAEELTAADESTVVVMDAVSDTAQITVKVSPADTISLVSALSADTSIAYVDTGALAVNSDGTVTFTVLAMGEGNTSITVMTDNGLTLTYSIYVAVEPEEVTDPDEGDVTDTEEGTTTDPGNEDETDTESSTPTDPDDGDKTDVEEGTTTDPDESDVTDADDATTSMDSMIYVVYDVETYGGFSDDTDWGYAFLYVWNTTATVDAAYLIFEDGYLYVEPVVTYEDGYVYAYVTVEKAVTTYGVSTLSIAPMAYVYDESESYDPSEIIAVVFSVSYENGWCSGSVGISYGAESGDGYSWVDWDMSGEAAITPVYSYGDLPDLTPTTEETGDADDTSSGNTGDTEDDTDAGAVTDTENDSDAGAVTDTENDTDTNTTTDTEDNADVTTEEESAVEGTTAEYETTTDEGSSSDEESANTGDAKMFIYYMMAAALCLIVLVGAKKRKEQF